MKQIWIGETGEYEQRYTAFVAISPEAALKYLQNLYPNQTWEYKAIETKEEYRGGKLYMKGRVDHEIQGSDSRYMYDLSQVDLAE